MQNLKFISRINKYKKGSLIVRLLPFFIVLTSCSSNIAQYGKVVQNSSLSKNSFTFSVTEEYLAAHKKSKIDKRHPKMTKSESRLLIKILKTQKYCLDENGKTSFRITSKQEKIYDMTFAYLIEQSYNARPVSPRMYYGKCIDGNSEISPEDVIGKVKDGVGKLK